MRIKDWLDKEKFTVSGSTTPLLYLAHVENGLIPLIRQSKTCKWELADDGCYDTSCGQQGDLDEFKIATGMEKLGKLFCPFCGGKIKE